MNLKFTKHLLAVIAIALFAHCLPAQPFQQMHAYDPGGFVKTGVYRDVVALDFFGPLNTNAVAVGTSFGATQDGLISYNDNNGVPVLFMEWRNAAGNPVEAEAICQTPTGNVVACFFDPGAYATDVVCTDAGGIVQWVTRLPNFHARDVTSDWAPPYGGEGIWLTGRSNFNNMVSLQGLTGAGIQVFAQQYFIADMAWNYSGSQGFEVKLDQGPGELVVAGTAEIAGLPQTSMIALRTDLFGNWIWGRSYTNPSGTEYYHGKALVAHPATPGHFVIAFEYSNIASASDQVAAMEIDPGGAPVWAFTYPGAGFFNGTGYIANGIDTDFGLFQIAGHFVSFAGAGANATYTLALDLAGTPLQMTNYDLGGFYPSNGAEFWGNDFSFATGHYYNAGYFGTFPTAGGWPQGPDPNSFYLVGSDPIGNSTCSFRDVVGQVGLGPAVFKLVHSQVNLPPQAPSPLFGINVDPRNVDQCVSPKRGLAEEAEAANAVSVAYSELRSELGLQAEGDLTGTGRVELVDMQGKVLMSQVANSNSVRFDVSSFSAGVYLLRYDLPGIAQGIEKVALR